MIFEKRDLEYFIKNGEIIDAGDHYLIKNSIVFTESITFDKKLVIPNKI